MFGGADAAFRMLGFVSPCVESFGKLSGAFGRVCVCVFVCGT